MESSATIAVRFNEVDSVAWVYGPVGYGRVDDSLRISRYVDDVAGAVISDYRNRGRVARKRIGQCAFVGDAGVFVSSVYSNPGKMRASDPNLDRKSTRLNSS